MALINLLMAFLRWACQAAGRAKLCPICAPGLKLSLRGPHFQSLDLSFPHCSGAHAWNHGHLWHNHGRPIFATSHLTACLQLFRCGPGWAGPATRQARTWEARHLESWLKTYIRLGVVVQVCNISTWRLRQKPRQEGQECRALLTDTGNLVWGCRDYMTVSEKKKNNLKC